MRFRAGFGCGKKASRPGQLVAIQGVGGLGHLGIQFARRMGFRVAEMNRLASIRSRSSIDAEDTLSFSSLQQIRPMIETVPLANAAEAYGRMMRNEARFRIVLVTGQ